jgi:hypothetical protein
MLERRRSTGSARGEHRRRVALGLCLALAACRKPPAERLDQALQTATAWAATAEWIGEIWARGEVPAHFAERSLAATGETLADEEKRLAALPPAARGTVGEHLRALRAAVGAARSAVARGDAPGMARPMARIAAEERALRAMRRAGSPGSPAEAGPAP